MARHGTDLKRKNAEFSERNMDMKAKLVEALVVGGVMLSMSAKAKF